MLGRQQARHEASAPAGTAAAVPPSTAVADVLALRGRTGWLSPPLQPVAAGARSLTATRTGVQPGRVDVVDGGHVAATSGAVTGHAVTVQLGRGRGGFGPLYELLSGDLTGRVLVLTAPDDEVAVWGGLLTLAAAQVGAAGILVAGAVRDTADCEAAGVPVWAKAVRTVGPAGRIEVAAVGHPVTIGEITVAPDDLVVLDGDGAVALPAASADAVVADARAYAEAEEQVAAALTAGTSLRDAYRLKAAAIARLGSGRNPRS